MVADRFPAEWIHPLYFASAVLPDGRVIIEGGQYNGNLSAGPVWTSLGAIYDPIANTWTSVSPPSGTGWTNTGPAGSCNGGIGDAASTVLPNGTYMLGASCANPALDALLNATTLGWNSTGAPRYDSKTDRATRSCRVARC